MINESILPRKKKGGVASFIDSFTEWSLNWIPDSMVFVLALTLVVFCMSWGLTNHGPLQLIDDYAKGFWMLLTFAMQMCVLMITGFVIADSKLVSRGITKLVDWPKTAKSTVVMFCLVSGISWFHWGIGLMVGIVMGQAIAVRKRGLGIHYPFLVAIVYGIPVIMGNGLSMASSLLLATPGHFLEKMTGIIPISQTVVSPFQLILMPILYITLPIVMTLIMPKKEHAVEIDEATYKEFIYKEPEDTSAKLRPAERWDRSRILQGIVALGIIIWVGKFVAVNGLGRLDLNTLNFTFFGLGLLLQGTPRNFIMSVKKGVNNTFGVIIQFPMYAGIFGMISSSGLAHIITNVFVSVSTPGTYPWIIFLYTGAMDFFVPSAGSKFVIEAPFIIPAAQQLGVPVPMVINAYGAGAQWANMLQPFWALPVLAAFRVRFQDMLPFTFVIWLWVGIVASTMFLLFPNGI